MKNIGLRKRVLKVDCSATAHFLSNTDKNNKNEKFG
jgi:hypothetical protein